MVADCKSVGTSPAGRFYQVTLIFDNLDEGDRLLLSAIERAHRNSKKAASVPGRNAAGAIPVVGGLN